MFEIIPLQVEIDFNSAYPEKINSFDQQYATLQNEILTCAKGRLRKALELKNYLCLIEDTDDPSLFYF